MVNSPGPMHGNPKDILLVTPVWNDSARLAVFGTSLAKALAASRLPIHWIIADDGSAPAEHERLNELRAAFARVFPHVGLHFAGKHRGKGAVIREAWALAPDAQWLAFVDADGSVSAEDVLGLIGMAVSSGDSVLGIRKRTASTSLVESPWRGLVHRAREVAHQIGAVAQRVNRGAGQPGIPQGAPKFPSRVLQVAEGAA